MDIKKIEETSTVNNMFREPSSNRRMVASKAIEFSQAAENPTFDDVQKKRREKYERDIRGRLNPFKQNEAIATEGVEKVEDESIIFPKRDQEVIRLGLRALVERLEQLEGEDLPPVIVLPDISARPLVHCVRPVLEALYTKKGRSAPNYQFLVLHSSELVMQRREAFLKKDKTWSDSRYEHVEAKLWGQGSFSGLGSASFDDEEFLKSLGITYDGYEEYLAPDIRKKLEEDRTRRAERRIELTHEGVQEEALQLDRAWSVSYERLEEITKLAQAQATGKEAVPILVIDEFLAQGRTMKFFVSLLKEQARKTGRQFVQPMWFAFFESLPAGEQKDPDPEWSELLGGPVWHGLDTRKPEYEGFSAFTYNFSPFTMNKDEIDWAKRGKEFTVGAKKKMGEKYVQRTKVSEGGQELRQGLRKLGQQIAAEFLSKSDVNKGA